MTRPLRLLPLAAVASLLFCHWCPAQVQVTFPLQGYYRPGKYMPVRVATPAATAAPVVLRADGAVAVSVGPGAGPMNVVVPWLATGEVRSVRWDVAGVGAGTIDAPLTPIDPGQVLVGIIGADANASAAAAAELFPGKSVVPVLLSGTPVMGGDPAAWEALDAAVFDDANHVFLAELLGQGVSVVIRSDARPGGRWGWRGGPGGWFVAFDPTGPFGAIHPDVYAPVGAWQPGWPAPLRRRAILLALVYCLVALAALLWRRTWLAAATVVATSVAAAAGFAWWGNRQPMVCQVDTAVEIVDAGATQADRWTYYRPLRRRDVTVEWPWATKPVFASARHARETDLRLHVGAAGRPAHFTWRAGPGTTLAFLNRGFSPPTGSTAAAAESAPLSPTRELALQSYLTPGDVILADPADGAAVDDDAGWLVRWPCVTVRRGRR